jgi:hypothetical protein
MPDDTKCENTKFGANYMSRCIDGRCVSNLRNPEYEEKRMQDEFFTSMGETKKLSSRAMYRDIEYLENCKAACTADVDCTAIGYDMASTVCVLYGEKRKIRPPMWEILHGVDGYPPLNGMIFLKVEDAVERIPDNSMAVFIIGPPGITIVLTVLATIFGIRRWFQLRAKRKRKEKRRFERMLQSNNKKLNKLTAGATKRLDQKHGRHYRFGYGITWSKGLLDGWLKRKSKAIVSQDREDHEDLIDDDEDDFFKRLEHDSDAGQDPQENARDDDDEDEDEDDLDQAPQVQAQPEASNPAEAAPEQQKEGSNP